MAKLNKEQLYTILIDYQDGDSNGYENYKETIEHTFTLDVAVKNLQRIKEHYAYYEKMHSRFDTPEERAKVKKPDCYVSDGTLLLLVDSKTEMNFSVFWTGYFERLHGAKIVPASLEDMYPTLEFEFTT